MKRIVSSAQKATVQVARIDRFNGVTILGQSGYPAHRPPSVGSLHKQVDIAQHYALALALNPKRPKKQIIASICKFHRVKRAYVYRVLAEVSPERWALLQQTTAAAIT